jgi:hypothetical protein
VALPAADDRVAAQPVAPTPSDKGCRPERGEQKQRNCRDESGSHLRMRSSLVNDSIDGNNNRFVIKR